MPVIGTVFPESREWVGIARELVTGTVVAPAIVVPVEKAEPDEKPTFLDDKSLRGFMAEEYGLIQGTEFSDFNFHGPVYMDSIGHVLLNIFGDYSATGSTPTSATTFTAPLAVGAVTGTLTSAVGYSIGSVVQIGSGITAEVVVLTGLAGSVATWANNPCRFAHAATPAAAIVSAPFTHTFSLLNSGNGQPVTHTVSFFQGISGAFGSRQYGSWCASEAAFTLDAEKLFTHATKGMSFLSTPTTGSALTQTLTSDAAQPVWLAKVGIGGPASGGTQINDVVAADVTISRQLKAYWTLSGQQTPYVIGRNGLAIAGKFTELAQNETPMLNMLNNIQPQLQIVLSNGLSGANLLSATFNCQIAAYDTAKLMGNDEIEYEVSFKGIANTTNAGGSAGYSPGSVVLQNPIPTY
jgi:hypothetical protein